MALTIGPKYTLKYTVSGTDEVKRDSLVEGGVFLVDTSHWIKTARSEHCILRAGSDWEYNLHHMEYIWLDVLDWPEHAMSRGVAWYLRPLPAGPLAFWPRPMPWAYSSGTLSSRTKR